MPQAIPLVAFEHSLVQEAAPAYGEALISKYSDKEHSIASML